MATRELSDEICSDHKASRVGNETSAVIMQHSALILIEPAIICILNSSIRQQLQNAVITRSQTAPSVWSQLINQLWPILGYQRNDFHASPWSRQDHRLERRLEELNPPSDPRTMRKSREQTKFCFRDLELRVHEATTLFGENSDEVFANDASDSWLAKEGNW